MMLPGGSSLVVADERAGSVTDEGEGFVEGDVGVDGLGGNHYFSAFDDAALVDVLDELGDIGGGGFGEDFFGGDDLDHCPTEDLVYALEAYQSGIGLSHRLRPRRSTVGSCDLLQDQPRSNPFHDAELFRIVARMRVG